MTHIYKETFLNKLLPFLNLDTSVKLKLKLLIIMFSGQEAVLSVSSTRTQWGEPSVLERGQRHEGRWRFQRENDQDEIHLQGVHQTNGFERGKLTTQWAYDVCFNVVTTLLGRIFCITYLKICQHNIIIFELHGLFQHFFV